MASSSEGEMGFFQYNLLSHEQQPRANFPPPPPPPPPRFCPQISSPLSTSRNKHPHPSPASSLKEQICFFPRPSRLRSPVRLPKPMKHINSHEVAFKFTSNPIRIVDTQHEEDEKTLKEEEENLDAIEASSTQALLSLPLFVFFNILSRLPIKRLAVCRCVCKTWRTIVHNPHFTKMHHTKAIQSQYNRFSSTTSLIFTFKYLGWNPGSRWIPCNRIRFIHFLEHDTDESFDRPVLVNPTFFGTVSKSSSEAIPKTIVGSCNGLLCLCYAYGSVYILNPVTGEYIIVPVAYKGLGVWVYGFGFDHVANKYKVIRVSLQRPEPNESRSGKIVGEIYTLGSGEWRMLADVPHLLHEKSSSVFVNGCLHWMAETSDKRLSSSGLIVAFHVGREEFEIIPPPPGLKPSCSILGDLGGYISIFDHSFHDSCNIWVMKDYGVESSWTKKYVISQENMWRSHVVPKPILVMKNGNILMILGAKALVCYDPMSKKFTEIARTGGRYNLNAITHVGSLLSLQDIVQPTNGHKVASGRWYGNLRLIHT